MAQKLLMAGLIIILVMGLLALSFQVVIPAIQRAAGPGPKRWCQGTLHAFALAAKEFADERGGKLPFEPNWCDVFHDVLLMSPKGFICDGGKTKPCSYALNENVMGLRLGELPTDVVVLFDSKPGWNQVGGAGLLAPENHKGKGCNILFGDFTVKFVDRENLGQLKWDVEPSPERKSNAIIEE